MKYEIKNRLSKKVQFVADIDCADDALESVKIGLAVKWGVTNGAYLSGAYLSCANLSRAYLSRANLSRAYLSRAYLSRAYLVGAYLSGADLSGADLSCADLSGADLSGADLLGANLSCANLSGADFSGADFSGADLLGANLLGANLSGAIINERKIKDLYILGHPNNWTALTYLTVDGKQRVAVGCQDKTISEGRAYWAGKDNRREILAVLDYAKAIGKVRGWT